MSSFPRLPSVWDGPMVLRPEPPVLSVQKGVTVTICDEVATWFRDRGLDVSREAEQILRAHIHAKAHDTQLAG
ncbi:hypothetical protein [uncultured Alsobacter sp.]|uniref:hypothetical protein n=1 Tax=uncultured Alsobacter sp. TaxID=1748258 RepID=UPI0025F5568C|nr:hypothetical protein [uncultured Alsobacter sp.]